MGLFDKFADIIRENDDDEFDDFYEENQSYPMPAPPKREKHNKSVRVPRRKSRKGSTAPGRKTIRS